MVSILLVLFGLLVFGILPNSLIILTLAFMIVIIVYRFPKIFKNVVIVYLVAVLLSIASVFVYDSIYLLYIYKGYLGYAFFMVVMFIGVLPKKFLLTRQLYRFRGELSVLGFIFISSHAFLHLFGHLGIDLFGIVSYVLMIPLTFISFRVIKNEMDLKDWFRIQKVAYVIYIGMFVHLLFVSEGIDVVFYAVYLTLYVNNRLLKEFIK